MWWVPVSTLKVRIIYANHNYKSHKVAKKAYFCISNKRNIMSYYVSNTVLHLIEPCRTPARSYYNPLIFNFSISFKYHNFSNQS